LKIKKNILKKIEDDYLTFNGSKKSQISHQSRNILLTEASNKTDEKYKNLLSKLGFDILETERVKSNVREKQAIERCKLLYEKGKLKNEINKLKYLKNNEIRDKNIIKDCTFKPRTNSAKKLISGNTASSYLNTNENKETITSVKNGSNINNTKNNNLKTNSNFNFARKLNRNNGLIIKKKKLSELPTFKPNIKYNKHIDKVFNPEKNIVNDYSTRIFMTRYNNARKQSTEKKKDSISSKN